MTKDKQAIQKMAEGKYPFRLSTDKGTDQYNREQLISRLAYTAAVEDMEKEAQRGIPITYTSDLTENQKRELEASLKDMNSQPIVFMPAFSEEDMIGFGYWLRKHEGNTTPSGQPMADLLTLYRESIKKGGEQK